MNKPKSVTYAEIAVNLPKGDCEFYVKSEMDEYVKVLEMSDFDNRAHIAEADRRIEELEESNRRMRDELQAHHDAVETARNNFMRHLEKQALMESALDALKPRIFVKGK